MRKAVLACSLVAVSLLGCSGAVDADDEAYCIFLDIVQGAEGLGIHAVGPEPSDPTLRAIRAFIVQPYPPSNPVNTAQREFNQARFEAAAARCEELGLLPR
jgi:hypothetical protein